MPFPTTPGSDGGLPHFPLRVSRIQPGSQEIARVLTVRVFGLFTHYVRGRSVYCDRETCCPAVHRSPLVWKGYIGCELYRQKENIWLPTVLEVTEHLELAFRHVYQRGQIWELWRLPESRKKRNPVEGRLVEQLDPDHVSPPFSIVECLRHLYHVDRLDLDAANPLPDVVMVQARPVTQAPVLPARRDLVDDPSPAERQENAQRLHEFLKAKRYGQANGKPSNGNGSALPRAGG